MKRIALFLISIFIGSTSAANSDLATEFAVLPSTTVLVGEPITFRVTVRNLGPDTATGATATSGIFVNFPRPLSSTCPYALIIAQANVGVFDAYGWMLLLGNIAAGDSITCEISVLGAYFPDEFSIPVNARSFVSDNNQENNMAAATLLVFAPDTAIPTISVSGILGLCSLIFVGGLLVLAGGKFSRVVRREA